MSVAEVEFGQMSSGDASASASAAPAALPARADAAAAATPAEPSPPRDDDQTSASASAAQTCFTDGLHSFFAFLTLEEFAVVSRCCRSWRAAALTQPPFRLSRWGSFNQLEAIAHSHLARHIDHVVIPNCSPSELSSVLSLCCRLPYLASLLIERDSTWWGDGKARTPMQMPSTLRTLDLVSYSSHFRRLEWAVIDSVLVRFCPSDTPPLTSLRIRINADRKVDLPSQIPVETLSRILVLKDSLTELILSYQDPHFEGEQWDLTAPAQWSQAHIDVFRQMTRLEKLDPFDGRWSDEELIMLCAEPAPTHLHILPMNAPPLTAAGADALTRLPLTEVRFSHLRHHVVEDLSFLARIPSLESILLTNVWENATPSDLDALVDTLAACTNCTQLATPRTMTNEQLCRFLPSMTSLRDLDVTSHHREFRFGDLSFASSVPHLAQTLEQLHLLLRGQRVGPMPLTALHHFHALTNLRHLYVSFPVNRMIQRADAAAASGEFDLRQGQPDTFRRDRWPHMVQSQVHFTRRTALV